MSKRFLLFSLVSLIVVVLIVLVFAATFTSTTIPTSVNEDISYLYNFTITNTNTTANITQVNITLPSGFTFDLASTNGTSVSGTTFSNTSTVLTWSKTPLVGNGSVAYFWFNASAVTPGTFNFSITTLDSSNVSVTNESNVVTVNDTTVPSSTGFVAPTSSNNSNLSQSNIPVNVTATDNGVIDTIIIRLFNSTNSQINSSTSSTSPLFINFTGLSDGIYKINSTVNDTAGNLNSTVTRIIRLDTTVPTIVYDAPTSQQSYNFSQSFIEMNITATDSGSGLDTITINLYNSTNNLINTNSSSTSSFYINYTGLADGVYYFNATANDTAGNINNTATRTVTLDTTPPAVTTFSNTINNGNYSGTIVINVTVNDTTMGVESVYFNITNSSGTQLNFTKTSNSGVIDYNISLNTVGFTDGKFNITAYANDTQLNNLNNSERIQITIDNTVPVVFPANISTPTGDNYNYSGAIIFNITPSDVTSGIASVVFNITNSSGQQNSTSSASLSGISWNASFDTSTVPDGKYNITAFVTDAAGKSNNTAARLNIIFDNTAPTLSLTKANSTKSSLGIDVSITEATSGVNGTCAADRGSVSGTGTSQTLIESSLSCSTSYSYKVTCTDEAGNSGSSSATSFSTGACTSSGVPGGGGGGSGTTNPKKINSWTKITPGSAIIMKNFDSDFGIKEISIEVNNPAQNVKITVTKYSNKPSLISVEKSGKIYRYLQIEVANIKEELKKAIVTIQVEKSWISDNGINEEDVTLFRFDETNGEWKELITTLKKFDNNYNYYEVNLTNFSYFAISEKETVSPQEGDDEIDATSSEEIDAVAEGIDKESKKRLSLFWIILGLLLIAAVIVWFFISNKK